MVDYGVQLSHFLRTDDLVYLEVYFEEPECGLVSYESENERNKE